MVCGFLEGEVTPREDAMKRRYFEVLDLYQRPLSRAIDRLSFAPRRETKARSFFDVFMDEVTWSPRRRG